MRKRMQEQEIVKGRVNFYDFSKTKKRMLINNIRVGRETATQEEIEAAARKAQCHEFITFFLNKS